MTWCPLEVDKASVTLEFLGFLMYETSQKPIFERDERILRVIKIMIDVFCALASFFAMPRAREIAHSSASSISLFLPKNALFSFH